ncbi:MAG: hypothetical protein IVW36_08485 [Dehalococcoidia bacterium]|nr:hypothetical protein [Dehalococcoidia bacterium]
MPAALAPVVELMAAYRRQWALCGGWAVDAWVGRETREHADVDISVFVQDQRTLFEDLRGWQLVPHDALTPTNAEPWAGRELRHPGHLHGRRDRGEPVPASGILWPKDGFILDVQLDDRAGDEWLLQRQSAVRIPVARGILPSPWGLPTVAPEVLLFFKSRDLRRRDKLDFATLLPLLDSAQRAWLRDAVLRCGHPWSAALAAAG